MPHAHLRPPRRPEVSRRGLLFIVVTLLLTAASAAGLMGPLDTGQASPAPRTAPLEIVGNSVHVGDHS